MNIVEIVRRWLIENKYDGLCNPDMECGWVVTHFNPCGELSYDCETARNDRRKTDPQWDVYMVPHEHPKPAKGKKGKK